MWLIVDWEICVEGPLGKMDAPHSSLRTPTKKHTDGDSYDGIHYSIETDLMETRLHFYNDKE